MEEVSLFQKVNPTIEFGVFSVSKRITRIYNFHVTCLKLGMRNFSEAHFIFGLICILNTLKTLLRSLGYPAQIRH
jgi:uncharacterized membrane protein